MLICWLIGHRYDYDIKKPELLALVCTRCGKMCVIREIINVSAPAPKTPDSRF